MVAIDAFVEVEGWTGLAMLGSRMGSIKEITRSASLPPSTTWTSERSGSGNCCRPTVGIEREMLSTRESCPGPRASMVIW
jgi:hypothetical protein